MSKHCKSFIFIINGSNGVGKDTFIEKLKERLDNYEFLNISSIDSVKRMLMKSGVWDGKKDEKGRQLLADVKTAICRYSDFINTDLITTIGRWKPRLLRNSITFIHIREPEQIEIMTKRLEALYGEYSMVGTILIKRASAEAVADTEADKNVENYKYDIIYEDKDDNFEAAVNNMIGLINMINPQSSNMNNKED